jgi:hypothetical protein
MSGSKTNWKKIKQLEYDKYGFNCSFDQPIIPKSAIPFPNAPPGKRIIREKQSNKPKWQRIPYGLVLPAQKKDADQTEDQDIKDLQKEINRTQNDLKSMPRR